MLKLLEFIMRFSTEFIRGLSPVHLIDHVLSGSHLDVVASNVKIKLFLLLHVSLHEDLVLGEQLKLLGKEFSEFDSELLCLLVFPNLFRHLLAVLGASSTK